MRQAAKHTENGNPDRELVGFCPKGRKNEIHCTKIGIYE